MKNYHYPKLTTTLSESKSDCAQEVPNNEHIVLYLQELVENTCCLIDLIPNRVSDTFFRLNTKNRLVRLIPISLINSHACAYAYVYQHLAMLLIHECI